MKIVGIETRIVECLYEEPLATAWTPGQSEAGHGFMVLKIVSDEGLEGYASGLRYRLFNREKDRAIEKGGVNGPLAKPAADAFLNALLVGRDPTDVEGLIQAIKTASYFGRGRFWFAEMAVWDLLGKRANLPVYKMLGGAQDRIKGYASWATMKSPEEAFAAAKKYKDLGFRAIKMRIHAATVAEDIAQVAAVREAVGDDFDIMVDANYGRAPATVGGLRIWDVARAVKTARKMEKLNVLWLEEPLHQTDAAGLAELRSKTSIRIAGGEYNENTTEYANLLQSFDVLQPDAVRSGGVWMTRKIGALAESFNKLCILHTWGDGLLMHPSVHIAASMPNCTYLEMPDDRPVLSPAMRDRLCRNPIDVDPDGFVTVSPAPGFGMDIDWDLTDKLTVA